jgi:uncharacterized protein YprB with RNaseH-like and TPR domain
MLRNTFCHIPGIGARTEGALWGAGIVTWEDLLRQSGLSVRYPLRRSCADHLEESVQHFAARNPAYFAARLPSGQQWRLFHDFRASCAYLDIETTGLSAGTDYVTTIALYDGRRLRTYVLGANLDDFQTDVRQYDLLVTYNGSTFDLPFLERALRVKLVQAHIDLRFVLASLGIRGGLKLCERRLGVERQGLEEVDGFLAVQLWHEFQWKKNPRALETLLAYNAQDVLNLERLMVEAYNRKLQETPFAQTHCLPVPVVAPNPHKADAATVQQVLAGQTWRLPFKRS